MGIRARKRPEGAFCQLHMFAVDLLAKSELQPFWRAFSADGDKVGQMVFCIFMSKTRFAPHVREEIDGDQVRNRAGGN